MNNTKCPRCGAEPTITFDDVFQEYVVYCEDCYTGATDEKLVSGRFPTIEGAIDEWIENFVTLPDWRK